MNYTTLIADETTAGSIKNDINYSRISSTDILTEAEAWIYEKLRVREMTASASVAIATAANTASLPTGYLDPIFLGIPGVMPKIRLKDAEWFMRFAGFDSDGALPEGIPTYWTVYDELIQLNTKADADYTAKMLFYKTPTALSGSNETNWLTTRFPTLLRSVTRMMSAKQRKEYDMVNTEKSEALQAINEIMVRDDNKYRGIELDFTWESNSE